MLPLHGHMMYGYEFGTYHPGSYSGKLCFDPARNDTRWCAYGCCGSHDTQCCRANVAVIAGVSVLTLVVLCSLLAVCCCCCLRHRKAKDADALSLQQPPPPYSSTLDGRIMEPHMSNITGGHGTDQSPPYPTQNYPPGCYAPPAYSEVSPSALSSSSSSSSSSACQAYSIPMPPPPYTSRDMTGHDNKAFRESV